jgi:hypothetical protein
MGKKTQPSLTPQQLYARLAALPPLPPLRAHAPRRRQVDPTLSTPTCHTYALKAYSCERRADGWYISRTPCNSTGDKTEWSGPYQTVETACLAIARRLATELVDRHTRSIEAHNMKPGDPLYGLKSNLSLRTA